MPEGFRASRRIWWLKQHHVLPEETDKELGLEVRGFQSQELGRSHECYGLEMSIDGSEPVPPLGE